MKDFTEKELRAFAYNASQTVVIRTYQDGNSSDDECDATEKEQKALEDILYVAFFTLCRGGHIQTVKDMAEVMGHYLLPSNINCYDTVYCRIWKWANKYCTKGDE